MHTTNKAQAPVVLAIASGGGHWTQLLRLRPAFDGFDTVFVSTIADHADLVPGCRFYRVPEASRWERLRAVWCALSVLVVLIRVRPDVVVSTGALPGFFGVCFAKLLLRRRTIWVDSVANADEMSLSGQKAERWSDLCLTQWERVSLPDGPEFVGSVLG